jgi:hypothetical protein
MAFRTDGTTEYASGVGGYPFAWMYGGDGATQRLMLLNTTGDMWTSTNGWLSTALSGKQASGSYLTGNQTITLSGDASGSGATSISVTNNFLSVNDSRTISPSTHTSGKLRFGFTSWNNNGDTGGTYADYIHLRSYTDSSGGADNLLTFRKTSGMGMRLWQQTWGSSTAYAMYRDVALITVSDNAPTGYDTNLWWESDTGKLKIYYNDGNTAQWVDAMPIPDTSTFFSKAGGGITGPVNLNSSFTITGTTFSKKTNITATGAGWDDHLNLFSSNATDRWNVLVDSGASNRLRFAYNNSEKFSVNTSGDATASGAITAGGNITAYSDLRLKANIKTIDNALSKVQAIRGVTYNRTDIEKDRRYAGVIAQEVEAVLPEVVIEDNAGIKTVAYGNMVGLLIEAIKEQQTQIEELKAEVKALKA